MNGESNVADTLERLVSNGTLSADQARRVADALRAGPEDPAASGRWATLVEVAGYAGGALVCGGAALILSSVWPDVSRVGRLGLISSIAVALVVAALVAGLAGRGVTESRVRLRLASTLGALAALVAGGAAVLLRDLLLDHGDDTPDWFFGFHGAGVLLVAAPLYLLFRQVPALFMTWYGGLNLAVELGDHVTSADPDVWSWGWAVAGYGLIWLAVAAAGPVREPGAAGLLGGVAGLIGAAYLSGHSRAVAPPGLLVGVVVVAGCFLGFARRRRWPFLLAGVLVALIVPATAVAVWFDSELAAGATLVAVGSALLVAGLATLLTRRRGEAAGSVTPAGG